MFGVSFSEAADRKTAADYALEALNGSGSMSMNPFFLHVRQDVLFTVLDDFCASVRVAAKMLSDKTGIKAFNVEEARGAAAEEAGKLPYPCANAENNIRMAFEEQWTKADIVLRALKETPEDMELAGNAMLALRGLYVATKAVPIAYETANRYLDKHEMIFKPA